MGEKNLNESENTRKQQKAKQYNTYEINVREKKCVRINTKPKWKVYAHTKC